MGENGGLADLSPAIDSLRSRARNGDPQTRFEILKLAQELMTEAETTTESIQRISFASLEPSLALVGCEIGIFKHIASNSKPVSNADLAGIVRIEPDLLGRFTRALASYKLLEEVSPGQYGATKLTRAFASDAAESALKHLAYSIAPAYWTFSSWLSGLEPDGKVKQDQLSFHKAFDTNKQYYQWMSSPGQEKNMRYCAGYVSTLTDDILTWYDVFPVLEEVNDMFDGQPLWVDVGGSFGHRTKQFQARFPTLKGRLVVEDLPDVSAASAPSEGIEFIAQDVFSPQVLRGAKFYYMRYLLHDFTDEQCVTILQHLKDAMAPNSVILVDELVIADMNNHYIVTQLDMTMLAVFNSRERTLKQWETIFSAAGLKMKSFEVYKPAARNSIMGVVAK